MSRKDTRCFMNSGTLSCSAEVYEDICKCVPEVKNGDVAPWGAVTVRVCTSDELDRLDAEFAAMEHKIAF